MAQQATKPLEPCPVCRGKGVVTKRVANSKGEKIRCAQCRGSGRSSGYLKK